MSAVQPFAPAFGSNQVVSAASASATITIKPGNKQLRIVNTGANKAYIRAYLSLNGAQAATTADCPVAAGLATTITIMQDFDKVSYISATGTTLEIMTGEGF